MTGLGPLPKKREMKKLSLLFVLLGMFGMSSWLNNAQAQNSNSSFDRCYERLTDNHATDSNHFKINMDDLDFDSVSEIEQAALNHLLVKLGCDVKQVKNFKCKHVSEFEYSFVCSANIEQGYFFIAPDMLNSVNIIFNRFD